LIETWLAEYIIMFLLTGNKLWLNFVTLLQSHTNT
jgi:hypothetical protein